MGIRAEIKCIIKDFASCTVGANEAINAIANVVQRPKPPKPPKQQDLPLEASEVVLSLTLTPVPGKPLLRSRIQHGDDLNPEYVRVALEALCDFAKGKGLAEEAEVSATVLQ